MYLLPYDVLILNCSHNRNSAKYASKKSSLSTSNTIPHSYLSTVNSQLSGIQTFGILVQLAKIWGKKIYNFYEVTSEVKL